MIAIPTLGFGATSGLLDFMFGSGFITGFGKGIEFEPYILNGSGPISFPVELMRNAIRHKFLESQCDDLWFVDSDTLPSDNSLELFTVKDADMVAGIYPIPNGKNPAFDKSLVWSVYEYNERDGKESMDPIAVGPNDCHVIKADGAGTGCLIIPRKIMADDRLLFFKDEENPLRNAMFRTPRDPNGKVLWTDDLDFCNRARKLGYTLKVHLGVRWGHVKTVNVFHQFRALTTAFQAGFDYHDEIEKDERPLIEVVNS
jgi:hypothetical protein